MVPAQIKYEHIMLTPHSPLAPLVIKVSYSASVYFYVSGYSGIKNAVSYSRTKTAESGKFDCWKVHPLRQWRKTFCQ